MRKLLFVLLCCLALSAQAQVAYYCMTYSDFVNNNWKPIEELTEGRSDQAVQIKYQDNAFVPTILAWIQRIMHKLLLMMVTNFACWDIRSIALLWWPH